MIRAIRCLIDLFVKQVKLAGFFKEDNFIQPEFPDDIEVDNDEFEMKNKMSTFRHNIRMRNSTKRGESR